MTPARTLAALLVLASPALVLAAPPTAPIITGAGTVVDSVVSDNNGCAWNGGTTAPTTIHAYLVWYNNTGTPWTAGEQALVRTLLNNIGSTPLWSIVNGYGDPGTKNRTISVIAEATDPENEGTSFATLASAGAIVTANVVPTGSLANDGTNGLYVILPSTNDLTLLGGGAAAYHYTQSVGGQTDNFLIATRQLTALDQPCSPNNDFGFDNMVMYAVHELVEAVTDWNFPGSTGWQCSGSTELVDVCSNTFRFARWFATDAGASNGKCANLSAGGSSFVASPIWVKNSVGGNCDLQPITSGIWTTPCSGGAQCDPFSNVCLSWHCGGPTCTDTIKNGTETGIDCGGTCGSCRSGQPCGAFPDCTSGVCTNGLCQ